MADDNIDDDSGALLIRIQPERGESRQATLDPRRHSFSPTRQKITRLRNLKITERYVISIGQDLPPFYTRGPMLKTWGGLAAPEPAIGILEDGLYLRGGVDLRVFDLGLKKKRRRSVLVTAEFLR